MYNTVTDSNHPMPNKEKIHDMFNSIARDYDLLNHLMSLGIDRTWRRRALRQILPTIGGGGKVLDLACGTGDFSIAIARAAKRKGLVGVSVVGADLSEGMLSVMEGKVAGEGLGDIVGTVVADGEALPFGDGEFQCVTIAFGIRNFEDREKGLREMLRVLGRGGRLVLLELSLPSNAVVRWLFNIYFTGILPLIGGKISGDKGAYKYLPASVLKFPGKEEFMGTLRSCGFAEVRHKAFSLGICRMYTGIKP